MFLTTSYQLLTAFLLLLFLFRKRRIDVQQSVGQPHPNFFAADVHLFQKGLRKGDLVFLRSFHHQQGGFASAESHIADLANLAVRIPDHAAHQIADVGGVLFQFRPLADWNLQFASDERLGLANRIEAAKLQNYLTFMKPEGLQFQFAARPVCGERKQPFAFLEALGKICVEFGRDFALPALRFPHAGDGDKFFAYSRISSV